VQLIRPETAHPISSYFSFFVTHGSKAKSQYKISCELRNYHEKMAPKINRKIYITRHFTRNYYQSEKLKFCRETLKLNFLENPQMC